MPLVEAVRTNIGTTDLFYGELQRVVDAAKASPDTPVILEAHTPHVYEPVFSLSYYMPALGVRNRMAVRLHPNEKSEGKLHEDLWQALSRLEQKGRQYLYCHAGHSGWKPQALHQHRIEWPTRTRLRRICMDAR